MVGNVVGNILGQRGYETYNNGEELYYGPVQGFNPEWLTSKSKMIQGIQHYNINATKHAIDVCWDFVTGKRQ